MCCPGPNNFTNVSSHVIGSPSWLTRFEESSLETWVCTFKKCRGLSSFLEVSRNKSFGILSPAEEISVDPPHKWVRLFQTQSIGLSMSQGSRVSWRKWGRWKTVLEPFWGPSSVTCLGSQEGKLLNPALPSFGLFPWQHCGLAASAAPEHSVECY